jgi:hypothetical protein
VQIESIIAHLSGSDICEAEGLMSRSSSPVLNLCRMLVAAGHDPSRPMDAFRGETLALHIRTIGEAAAFEVNSHGTDFVKHRPR